MSCSENKGERGNNEISLCKNDKGETEKKKKKVYIFWLNSGCNQVCPEMKTNEITA